MRQVVCIVTILVAVAATSHAARAATEESLTQFREKGIPLCVRCDLRDIDVAGKFLRMSNLRGSDLRGAKLSGADFGGANMEQADLRGADLRGANLAGVHFIGADLRGANFEGAELTAAILRGAILDEADFKEARLRGAYLHRTDLRQVKNLTQPQISAACGTPKTLLPEGLIAGQCDEVQE